MLIRLIILSALFTGCLSGPACAGMPLLPADLPAARRLPAPAGFVSLSRFAARHGLRLVSRPGAARIVLRNSSLELVLARGLRLVAINGRAHRLASAPRVMNRELMVPAGLTGLLPAGLGRGRISGVVILDPGHGGRDTGAVANGIREKDVVLDIALRAAGKLRARGARVILTRRGDRFISLAERSRIANSTPGAVFVSIHANSLSRRNARAVSTHGIETFVLTRRISESYRVNKAARTYDLQQDTEHGMQTLSPARERAAIAALSKKARTSSVSLACRVQAHLTGITHDTDRGVRQMNLAVLRENYFGPAILTEIGFISHPPTAAKFETVAYRDRLAQAISDGVAEFLQAQEK